MNNEELHNLHSSPNHWASTARQDETGRSDSYAARIADGHAVFPSRYQTNNNNDLTGTSQRNGIKGVDGVHAVTVNHSVPSAFQQCRECCTACLSCARPAEAVTASQHGL